jgi:hypothetical protein
MGVRPIDRVRFRTGALVFVAACTMTQLGAMAAPSPDPAPPASGISATPDPAGAPAPVRSSPRTRTYRAPVQRRTPPTRSSAPKPASPTAVQGASAAGTTGAPRKTKGAPRKRAPSALGTIARQLREAGSASVTAAVTAPKQATASDENRALLLAAFIALAALVMASLSLISLSRRMNVGIR